MKRAPILVALAVAPLLFCTRSTNAGIPAPEIRFVARGDAVLAARAAADQPWGVLPAGALVPLKGELRTAAGGVCELQLPAGSLLIDSCSHLELDAARQHLVLHAGRALLTANDKPASADVHGATVEVANNSAVELTAAADSASVAVVTGAARAKRPDGPALELVEHQTVNWKAADAAWSARPLTEDEQQAVTAWSAAPAGQGLGQLVISDAQSGAFTRLNVARYHVNVVLEPPVALVQIDQSFYNPLPRQEEGTFVFNLPQGASVSRFAMYVNPTDLVEGELIERKQAASIYQSIVTLRRDPAILEQIGNNLFKMRVFPVPPRDSKRILLDFTVPLESRDGQYAFHLPLLSDLKPIWDFQITGNLQGPTLPGSLEIDPACTIQPARHGDELRFDFNQRMFRPTRDLTVRFRQKIEGTSVVRSFQDDKTDKNSLYFWAALPPDPQASPPDAGPADLLVLVDSSGSGQPRRQLTEAVRSLLANLRPADRFRLACVDITARPLGPWQAAGPMQIQAALAALDQEIFLGGVDLAESVGQALKLREPSERRPLIVYFGDAAESVSSRSITRLAESLGVELNAAAVPLFAATTQRASRGRMLLDAVAEFSGGLVFDLGQAEGRQDFFGWLLGGLPVPEHIQSLQVTGTRADDLFYPSSWPRGQVLRIAGRCPPSARLEVTAVLGRPGHERTLKFPLERIPAQDDVFVGRCWAQRKLDALRAQEDQLAGADNLRPQITALSQEWSLMSPYTAFLVLESEQDYERWNIKRQQRHRYWRPLAARPDVPLPDQWLRLVAVTPGAGDDDLRGRLAAVREAMQQWRLDLARRRLARAAELPGATAAQEYRSLLKTLGEREAQRAELSAFQIRQRALDANRHREDESSDPPPLARLLVGEVSSDFLERFPQAGRLLQPAHLPGTPAGFNPAGSAQRASVSQLLKQFEASTGVPVIVDERALQDAGTDAQSPVNLWVHGVSPMSWRSCFRLALGPLDLAYVENSHRLTVTTKEKADAMRSLGVYPVADLLLADRQPERALLSDPYLDLELTSQERIKSKLKRSLRMHFDETPLEEVADDLAVKLGVNVVIDAKALIDAGTGTDTPVTRQIPSQPASDALHLLLDPMDLTYVVKNEVLLITTKEQADAELVVRLHNGAGIVFESMRPATNRPAMSGMGGMGGMGSMMGGMGMGMGGGMFGGAGGSLRGAGGGGFAGASGAAGAGGGSFGGGFGGGSMAGAMSGDASAASPQQVRGLQDNTPAGPQVRADNATAGAEIAEFRTNLGLQIAQTQGVKANGRRGHGAAGAQPAIASYDADSIIDTVTTNISPTTWDEVGGPGSIAFFRPTLDFVFAQTADVHDQIDDLFVRLRKIPAVGGPAGARPAERGRGVSLAESGSALENLLDIITTTVAPTTWDEVGGPGSIATDRHRLALIVSTSNTVHESIVDLLTMLRRSRLGLTAARSDFAFAGSTQGPLLDALANAAPQPQRDRPVATPEEIELLKTARREPGSGRWQWIRTTEPGSRSTRFALLRSGGRLELQMPGWTGRCEGTAAALAYPGLTLWERGPWAAALRDLVDSRLPWWPHRSNQELAEMFDVESVAAAPAEPAGAVWLRFRNPAADPSDYVQLAFARDGGRPLVWQSYLGGQLFQTIRFTRPAPGEAGDVEQATLEAADEPLVQWRLTEQSADDPQLADVAAGWPEYVELVRSGGDSRLAAGLSAARRDDWPAAIEAFQAARAQRPGQPLLALLWAWSLMRSASDNSHAAAVQPPIPLDEVVKVLQDVARTGEQGLLQFLTRENFPALSVAQYLSVLESQPEKLRSESDWQRLIFTASEARLVQEALAYVAAAAVLAKDPRQQFACQRWQAVVLCANQRAAEAGRSAEDWVQQHPEANPEQLVSLACLLADYNVGAPAEAVLRRALAAPDLPAPVKSQYARRLADVRRGLARWRSLVTAIELLPAEAGGSRAELTTQLIRELQLARSAEDCQQLVRQITDRRLRAQVQLLLAQISPEVTTSADLYWSLREEGLLPDTELLAASMSWNGAGQSDRTIQALEAGLRKGTLPPAAIYWHLSAAYEAVGRAADARRAASQPAKVHRSDNEPLNGFDIPRSRGGGMF